MDASDLANLNATCGSSHTGIEVQTKMLKDCALVSFAFGLIYGYILLDNARNEDAYFNVGRWEFASYFTLAAYFVVLILLAAIPAIIFCYLLPLAITNSILVYLSNCLGFTLAGLFLVYLTRLIERKLNFIEYDIS